jgi:Domain of unknown function (DUF4157)
MGRSLVGYLSRKPQYTSERGLQTTPSMRRSGQHGVLNRQRSAGTQAVTTLLPPNQVPAVAASPCLSGKALDPVTRPAIEACLTYDFSRVRVHSSQSAAESGTGVEQQAKQGTSGSTGSGGGDLAERLRREAGTGSPLPTAIRSQLETFLGASLAGVRLHTNREADSAAKDLNARAFTIGRDIFFREGAYDPSSTGGYRVLAHESAHTVQRIDDFSGAMAAPGVTVSVPDCAQERWADAVANALADQRDRQADGGTGAFHTGDVILSARPEAVTRHAAAADALSASHTAVLQVSRFTAELENSRVFLRPESKDTDADLARVLEGKLKGQTLKGAQRIEITDALPQGVIKAFRTAPLNCAQFVKTALKGAPASPTEKSTLDTQALWEELLRVGFRVSGVWLVNKSGEVIKGPPTKKEHKIATPQTPPKLGDVVFMKGGIHFIGGRPKVIDPEGTNFTVTWDHVGIFIVRDRLGRDWHLAKDGDENPLGVYFTGMKMDPELGLAPGAYVKGAETLLMYLTAPAAAPGKETPKR